MIKAVPPCLALALVCAPAWAQFPAAGPELQVNTYTTGTQFRAGVSADASGNFVIVWQTNQEDAADIYAQRYAPSGSRIGGEFRVNANVGGTDAEPAVAMARTGEFVVVWTGPGYPGQDIKGRRYDALNTYMTGLQFSPAVAVDTNGNFVVVWASNLQDGSHNGVFGRRFDAVGTPIGLDFAVNSYTTGRQDSPQVAVNAAGDFVVIWHGDGQDDSSYGIFGQRFAYDGGALGGEFHVNVATAGVERFPAVASTAAGGFIVVWTGSVGSTNGILGRQFEASGFPTAGEYPVSLYTTGSQSSPAIASDPDGNFVVSWTSYGGQDGDSRGISARVFDSSTNPLAPEFQVNTFTTSDQVGSSVAFGHHGDVVVAWESWGQDAPAGPGVYAQRYSDLIFGDGFDPSGP
jgi:hypothetical protein